MAAPRVTAADMLGKDGMVYPDFSRTGIPGGIPDVKVVVNVTEFGANPNNNKDASPAIQAAVEAAENKGGGAVLLPAGDYFIDHTIKLNRGGVVIRGADPEKTRLIPRFEEEKLADNSSTFTIIEVTPGKANRRYDVYPDQAISRGDMSVKVPEKDAKAIKVGDIVVFTATPPTDVISILSPKLNTLATDGSYGSIYCWQYLKVASVAGDTVTFEQPIRLDIAVDQKPKLMHVPNMLAGCGVENLTISQSVTKKGISGISFNNTVGCWVKGVTVLKIGDNPVSWDRSWHFEMKDCRLDESLSRGGAVAYFGFGFACDGLIQNVRATRLRHLAVSMASNGIVFRDCYLENIDINFHLHWPNEVLFENCHVDSTMGPNPGAGEESRGSYGFGLYTPAFDGDIHNPAGPRLTFYHNQITSGYDGVMLGGGAAHNTIVAYNQFQVGSSFAAVLKLGCDGTIFRDNVFVLAAPNDRRRWMTPQTYSYPKPETVKGVVFFPQGASKGVSFVGNIFCVPEQLPLFANDKPEIDQDNKLIVSSEVKVKPAQLSLAGEWQATAVNLIDAAPTPAAANPDPGVSDTAKKLLLEGNAKGDWSAITMPAMLASKPVDLGTKDGEVVIRRNFDVPAALVGKPVTLSLGAVDDYDETWINGRRVGATSGSTAWNTPRMYTVPADLLRQKGNFIAIRVWDAFGGGGLSGTADQLWIGDSNNKVDLKLPDGMTPPPPPEPSLYAWEVQQRMTKH